MQGKTHTEETKKKMSDAAKGKPKNPDAVRKAFKDATGQDLGF
jgi:hypothetical protein